MKEDNSSDFSVAPGAEIVSDSRCFVCGLNNPGGLQVRFFRDGDAAAQATWKPEQAFTGYDGMLHGGVTSALLDEIMIKAVLARGRLVVTGRMTVTYHKPVLMGGTVQLAGRLVKQRGKLYETEGEICDADGMVLASAAGTYVEVQGRRREMLMKSIGSPTGS